MSKKITKLTKEQEAYLPEFREQWRAVGLLTDAINQAHARKAVCDLYAVAGLNEPAVMIFSSPAMCLLARCLFLGLCKNKDQLRGRLGGQDVFQRPWTIGGQDAYWLSFYDFGSFIGVNYDNQKHFDAYKNYAKNCGWMFAYNQIAFVSDRPKIIKFDERGLLHNEVGQSVEFSDGWGICSWHGTRIPHEWILQKKHLTPEIALRHENIEQRRAACEIIGWHNILKQLDAKTINKDAPEIGELLEVNLPDIGKEKFLKVKCGTGRIFAIPVPPNMQTALEANAWTYGLSANDYQPEART